MKIPVFLFSYTTNIYKKNQLNFCQTNVYTCIFVLTIFVVIICGNKNNKNNLKTEKMNEDVLASLAQGYIEKSCPTPLSNEMLAALAASASSTKKVQQIGSPVVARTIDLS